MKMPRRPPSTATSITRVNLEIEAEDQDRRHRDADAEGDRLARRAGGLDDVVLEDRRVASAEPGEQPGYGDGNDRDRNRRAHREPDLQHQVERRGAEDEAQDRAPTIDGDDRELAEIRLGGDVGVNYGGPSGTN